MAQLRSLRLVVTLTLSYFVVFLVPVVSMLLYYYPLTNRIITQKETNWTQYSIDQVRQTLDGVLTYIYDLPGDLINNQDLYLGPQGEDWDRWTTAREFRKYVRADHLIHNTFLFLHRDGYLYSVNGTAGPAADVLQARTGYSYPGWPASQLLEALAHPKGVLVRPSEEMVVPERNLQRMVTFLVPVPINSRHPVGTLLVLVREDSMLELIRPIAQRTGGEVWISDQGGNLVLGVGTDGELLAQVPPQVSLNVRSQVNGWSINSRYPAVSQLAEVREVQATTLLASFGLLVLGILVIAWAVRFHYLPVKMLAQFARAALPPPGGRTGETEWETIQGSLTTLRQAAVHARRDLLGRLVAGDFADREDFHSAAQPFGLTLEHRWLSVALLAVEPGVPLPSELQGVYHEAGPPGALWLFQDQADDWILLFCHADPAYPGDCLTRLLAWWFDPASCTVAGLSGPVDQSSDLRRSLSDARRIADGLYLDQGSRWAGTSVLVETSPSGGSFPAESVQLLETVVRADDSEAIRRTAKALLQFLGRSGLGSTLTRTLALTLVGILREGQRHHGLAPGAIPEPTPWGGTRVTRAQLVVIVDRDLEVLCDAVDRCRGDKPELERRRIRAYLEAQVLSGEGMASLKDVSEAFGMSESGFSRHFKKLIGCSFKDYVDQLRIDLSKRLLVETDDPVEVIGQRVGYAPSNSSSFIRSFKRSMGMTPGQYRQHKQEGSYELHS